MIFSDDLPDGCPLPKAQDCAGKIYMLSPANPVRDQDCLSQAERGRAQKATGDQVCTRHGLSVFPDYQSCAHQQALFPALGEHIVSATLQAIHGKILDTPSNSNPKHMTWWPCKNVHRSKLFAVEES